MQATFEQLLYHCLHECFLAFFWHDEDDVIGGVSLNAECFSEKLIDRFVLLQAKDIFALVLLEANLLMMLVFYVIFESPQEIIIE